MTNRIDPAHAAQTAAAPARPLARAVILLAAAVLGTATGCHVEDHKADGKQDVRIATPFGGMDVKTGEGDVQSGVGMTPYPGATLSAKDKGNSNAADVKMNFGSFHLGIKALSYRTADNPDKVLAFYRHDLGRYGAVVLCKDGKAVGQPARTQDGLGCGNESGSASIHTDEQGDVGELKAGSRQHQHVVAVDRDGAGTKFGLVALDLPGSFKAKDEKDAD